jgi:chorismate mutase
MVKAAARYSKSISIKGKDSHRARAYLGIPAGGQRPFGWEPDKRTLKEQEAKLLKKSAKWVLAGVGVPTIEKRWFKLGIRGIKGQPVDRRTIKNMLLSPRIAGIRKYRKPGHPLQEHYLLGGDGKYVMGQHEPILDIETWEAVVDKLTNPDRRGAGIDVGKLRYLASTVLRCGECGGRCSGQVQENDRYSYACKNLGCGKVAGSGKAIDDLLTKLVKARLADRQVTVQPAEWPKAEELAELEDSKAKLLAQFKENSDMGTYIWPQIREKDKLIKALVKERAAYTQKNAGPKKADVIDRWDSLEVEQQRAIFEEVFEVVILNRATRPSNRFDPARLQPVFKKG